MDRIVKSATQVPSQRAVPRERKRSRANRKSCEYIATKFLKISKCRSVSEPLVGRRASMVHSSLTVYLRLAYIPLII